MDIKKDHINFAVGPVQISEEISRIGADPVPYFRTPDFSALMKENEALLKEFMDAPEDARAVFLTGSGTASMDAVTQNVFTKDDRLLVVAGGSFGHRAAAGPCSDPRRSGPLCRTGLHGLSGEYARDVHRRFVRYGHDLRFLP